VVYSVRGNPQFTSRSPVSSKRAAWFAVLAATLLVAVAFLALTLGTARLTPGQAFGALFMPDSITARQHAIVWSIRFPRIIIAMLVGAALATVGVVMQALLHNPLAEPGITGVSSGAAVGAVTGITLGFSSAHAWSIPLLAFAGAAVVALILQAVLQVRKNINSATIILVGVSISALAGAVINVLIANAKDDALVRSALFWLAGDLELRSWNHVAIAVAPVLIGIAILFARFRALDALSLGEHVAATSGVHVVRERIVLLLLASLITGAAVAVSGVISFVGLVVPHAMRLVIGASHSKLLPLSALGGALFLVLADTVARSAFGATVVQTGVVAALVGAPIFLFMLLRRKQTL
jgi:iron complex transport system permease protein